MTIKNKEYDITSLKKSEKVINKLIQEYKKGGIYIKPENKGKFTATKKATGKTTEELTHSKNPITKKRAIFAQNAAKWKHENGGTLDKTPKQIKNRINIPYKKDKIDTSKKWKI